MTTSSLQSCNETFNLQSVKDRQQYLLLVDCLSRCLLALQIGLHLVRCVNRTRTSFIIQDSIAIPSFCIFFVKSPYSKPPTLKPLKQNPVSCSHHITGFSCSKFIKWIGDPRITQKKRGWDMVLATRGPFTSRGGQEVDPHHNHLHKPVMITMSDLLALAHT